MLDYVVYWKTMLYSDNTVSDIGSWLHKETPGIVGLDTCLIPSTPLSFLDMEASHAGHHGRLQGEVSRRRISAPYLLLHPLVLDGEWHRDEAQRGLVGLLPEEVLDQPAGEVGGTTTAVVPLHHTLPPGHSAILLPVGRLQLLQHNPGTLPPVVVVVIVIVIVVSLIGIVAIIIIVIIIIIAIVTVVAIAIASVVIDIFVYFTTTNNIIFPKDI